jgi:hypothetical protein
VRQTALPPEVVERATADLADLDEDELRSLFERSVPKPL